MANVKSATVIAMSRVSGCRIRPKLWRIPMLSVSITAAPIRIGSAARQTLLSSMLRACARP